MIGDLAFAFVAGSVARPVREGIDTRGTPRVDPQHGHSPVD